MPGRFRSNNPQAPDDPDAAGAAARAAADGGAEVPWWQQLAEDFASRPEPFDHLLRDRLLVGSTASIDVMVRTAAASMVAGLALPLGYRPSQLRRDLDDARMYTDLADSGDPQRFFAAPPAGVPVSERVPGWPHFRTRDGHCADLSFASPYFPLNASIRDGYLGHRANRTAHARYWSHDDGPRPTIIAIHGFGAESYWLNEWFFALPWLYAFGCDVLLFTLPFHGPRKSLLSPFSGHGFFAQGLAGINEAFGQAICDLRVFFDWLRDVRGVRRIGVTGVSLGGYTAALLASVEPRLQFSIPNVPVTSIADLVLEWQPMGVAVQALMRRYNRSVTEIRHVLAVACPLTYPPVLPRERLMIVGGAGDRMAPPKHSRLLWEHWDQPSMHWFPGSHLLHLDRGAYLMEMARFMTGIGFVERRSGDRREAGERRRGNGVASTERRRGSDRRGPEDRRS